MIPVTNKITWKRLNWYGHVKRREEGNVLTTVSEALTNELPHMVRSPNVAVRGGKRIHWKNSWRSQKCECYDGCAE